MQVFETLYGTNELLSSFDSINALPPSKLVPVDRTSWLHTDQAPLRRGFFCVQGLVNMVDVSPETTGDLPIQYTCLHLRLKSQRSLRITGASRLLPMGKCFRRCTQTYCQVS